MKRIAMIGPELTPVPPIRGGATENWIDNVCRRIQRYQCTIFCPSDPALAPRERLDGVEYVRVPAGKWRRRVAEWRHRPDFTYAKRVARELDRLKPDLVHVQNRPLIAAYLKDRLPARVPVLLHMHNLYEYLGKYERPSDASGAPLDGFLAVSRFVLDRERNRLGALAGWSSVLNNGVDTDLYSPENRFNLMPLQGLSGKRVVLYTGKLREGKGVTLLFRAMKTVFENYPKGELILLLVGGTNFGRKRSDRKTDYYMELMDMVRDYGDRVVVTGFVTPRDIPPYYGLGTVYVCPSQLEEGFPSVLLEAMSSGLPVISTRMGGIPELIRHGENGLLMERADDPAELSRLIIGLLDDPDRRDVLGKRGRETVIGSFSWRILAENTESVYGRFLKE